MTSFVDRMMSIHYSTLTLVDIRMTCTLVFHVMTLSYEICIEQETWLRNTIIIRMLFKMMDAAAISVSFRPWFRHVLFMPSMIEVNFELFAAVERAFIQ